MSCFHVCLNLANRVTIMQDLNDFYNRSRPRFLGAFNCVCGSVFLLLFFLHQEHNNFLGKIHDDDDKPTVCGGLNDHKGYRSGCEFLTANPQCGSGGFFDYTLFFYCDCEKYSFIGYLVLLIWLVCLIYMLSNNASDYFCCCLENLSDLLKLPPVVAGVVLLPLGNGAPDVFSCIAAFVSSDAGEVGLNSVLGASLFVVSVVVGAICIRVSAETVKIDKRCFIRDVCFFMFILISILVILIVGEISVGGAIAFVSIYAVYALFVAANEILRRKQKDCTLCVSLLHFEEGETQHECDTGATQVLYVPHCKDETFDCGVISHPTPSNHLTLCVDSGNDVPYLQANVRNVAIYSNLDNGSLEERPKPPWGWNEGRENEHPSFSCSKLCGWLELPLTLPRRLTIPIVEEQRWSKGYAVASALLAPMLLAFLWNTQENVGSLSGEISYIVGATIGGTLGVLAYVYTNANHPPKSFLFPWLLGGFFMSIIWFYIIANELVALLEALGVIFAISPSILGLTVLAWGNSMGDLVSNLAMAANGGEGVQIAVSGCYAGPIFNVLAGLGVSMLLGAWWKRPASYVLPRDTSLYYTLGFIMLGLVWSLVLLPRNNMQPSKMMGIGLIVIYFMFLSIRLCMAMGIWSLDVFTVD